MRSRCSEGRESRALCTHGRESVFYPEQSFCRRSEKEQQKEGRKEAGVQSRSINAGSVRPRRGSSAAARD